MLGILVGSLCLAGFIKATHHRYYGYGGGGCGGGHRGFRGYGAGRSEARGRWGAGSRSAGQAFWLHAISERLDATPAQEKVLLAAFEELRTLGKSSREAMKGARTEVAQAFRSPVFSEEAVGQATARIEGIMEDARKTGIGIFAKVHEALDERQRDILAGLLENGLHGLYGVDEDVREGMWAAHPYRRNRHHSDHCHS
jgi:hypothetical protein